MTRIDNVIRRMATKKVNQLTREAEGLARSYLRDHFQPQNPAWDQLVHLEFNHGDLVEIMEQALIKQAVRYFDSQHPEHPEEEKDDDDQTRG